MKAISQKRREQLRISSTRYRVAHPEYREKARIRSRARYRADPEARRKERRDWVLANPEKYLWSCAKVRARKLGIEFSITFEDIKIPKICPAFCTKLTLFGSASNSPSLDRINNSKGYTSDNIQVISQRANRCKSDLSKKEMKLMALAFVEWSRF